eukprot:CAMPEP_0172647246 /NCGR_PEP_ID=MMETSP1068-20121228/240651_1 /TAXON_ID=35684 /ORGANISM="Pseudopedinella elastica, Strain CCMP716" /LENGTH=496 /DNA_ID=CAMNT_0013461519 /DNA_START=170 /DNA_END=1662 /DNA_ORIENTATION=-
MTNRQKVYGDHYGNALFGLSFTLGRKKLEGFQQREGELRSLEQATSKFETDFICSRFLKQLKVGARLCLQVTSGRDLMDSKEECSQRRPKSGSAPAHKLNITQVSKAKIVAFCVPDFWPGSHVFVVTYPSYWALAGRLALGRKDRVLIVDPLDTAGRLEAQTTAAARSAAAAGLPPESGRPGGSKPASLVRVNEQWQWLLLQRGLERWRSVLLPSSSFLSSNPQGRGSQSSGYQAIVRFRTDLHFPPGFRFTHCVGRTARRGKAIVYAQSDLMFYAPPAAFISVFLGMFRESVRTYRHHNLPEAEVRRLPDFAAIVGQLDGLLPSCMGPNEYAPQPRVADLRARQHPTNLFKVVAGRDDAKPAGLRGGPRGGGRRRLVRRRLGIRQPGVLPGGKPDLVAGRDKETLAPNVVRRWCGCKFGLLGPGHPDHVSQIGWRRREVVQRHGFQAEPAMAYHILTRNTSCLPMDVAHRECFFHFDDREGIAFGFEGNFTKPVS